MAVLLFFLALAAAAGAVALWRAADKAAQPAKTAESSEQTEPELLDPQTTDEPEESEDLKPKSQPDPEPEPEPGPKARPRDPRGLIPSALPGALRRQHRKWAEDNGYEFLKTDSYLVDEFTRGAAASGAAPRDIAAGSVFGHEMLLMDIGGVNVMAMRIGAAVGVVVDFRRGELGDSGNASTESASEDLIFAREVGEFKALASDAAVAQRFIDARVETALENLPAEVTAVWIEPEWVLGQTSKSARAEQWDAMVAPMALLADAARALPPRTQGSQVLRPEDGDPSRLMPTAKPRLVSAPVPVPAPRDEFDTPPVKRPEEPLAMPRRSLSEAWGTVEHRPLGGDEVDAIADGKERPNVDGASARLPRRLDRGASIFDDAPNTADTDTDTDTQN